MCNWHKITPHVLLHSLRRLECTWSCAPAPTSNDRPGEPTRLQELHLHMSGNEPVLSSSAWEAVSA